MQAYEPFILVLALVVIDYVTGIIGSVVTKSFSSTIMRTGLWHKLAYLVAIIVGLVLERLSAHYELGFVFAGTITTMIVIWIIITEVGSIMENLVKINPNLANNTFMRIFSRREEAEQIEEETIEEETRGKHAERN